MIKAVQEELNLRNPRKRPKPLQMELPFNDRKGRKARQALGRHLGKELKSFQCQIRGIDSTQAVVIAHDQGEARALYFQKIRDIYNRTGFTDIRVRRETIDQHAALLGKGVHHPDAAIEKIAKALKPKKQHGKAP